MSSIEEYFEFGFNFCTGVYPTVLDRYREVKLEDLTVEQFWREYIWCVYVSGFSSKVVDQIIYDLLVAYGTHTDTVNHVKDTWLQVRRINRHERKFDAIVYTANLLEKFGWESFKSRYLGDVNDIKQLGFMGPVTSHHLGRNIGLNAVKADLHLVRLSDFFGFDDAFQMCEFLSGLSGERVGVVDLILFYTASTFGTLGIRNGGR